MGADEMTSTMQPPRTSQAPAAATGSPAGATPPAGEVGWRASDVLGRIVAMLLLPLSIAPVLLLGPSVLRAPVARLPVELDVSVPVRNFRVRNLLALELSQVIESGWGHGEDVPLAAGEVQLAWSEFEVIDTQLAVRVTRLA